MVVTHDDKLAGKIKTARSHGMTTLTWDRHRGHSFSYDVVAKGYNYRLDEMRAALGLVQLKRLEPGNARRRELTHAYRAKLKDLDNLEVPFGNAPAGSAHHLFPILLGESAERADFMAALAKQGIQTSIHYPPVHLFSYYRSLWEEGHNHRLPLTEDIASRLVTLPLYPSLTMAQLDTVVAAIYAYFR
jgi:dTDP-4-amino-4,6-dideoxygalactose transaminase